MEEERAGRVPPNNLDAERSVLGAMMQDHEALSLAIEALRAEDIYHPATASCSTRCTGCRARASPWTSSRWTRS